MMLIHGRPETRKSCDKGKGHVKASQAKHELHDDKGGAACFGGRTESSMHQIAALGHLVACSTKDGRDGERGRGLPSKAAFALITPPFHDAPSRQSFSVRLV